MATPRLALLACTIAATLSGCVSVASLQDWQYARTNKARASEAWIGNHTSEQRGMLGGDYEAGYKAGFFDTATGKDCQVPPVPPPKYWAAKYQSCEGQACIQNWFCGYQGGIVSAQARGFPQFHEVPTSVSAPVVNRTACGTCYSPHPCRCGESFPAYSVPSYLSGVTPSAATPTASSFPGKSQTGPVVPAGLGLIGPVDLSAMPATFAN